MPPAWTMTNTIYRICLLESVTLSKVNTIVIVQYRNGREKKKYKLIMTLNTVAI